CNYRRVYHAPASSGQAIQRTVIARSVALGCVIPDVQIGHQAVIVAIVAQNIIAGAQDTHRLRIEAPINTLLFPGTNLSRKILEFLAFYVPLAQIYPAIHEYATPKKHHQQNHKANGTLHLSSVPSDCAICGVGTADGINESSCSKAALLSRETLENERKRSKPQ